MTHQGTVEASNHHWQRLRNYTQGHPFVLKVMGGIIHQFMQGDLATYLQRVEQGALYLPIYVI